MADGWDIRLRTWGYSLDPRYAFSLSLFLRRGEYYHACLENNIDGIVS